MTLQRQLFTLVSVLFLVVLAGVEAIYLHGARANLQEQLASQAQEAATSLSLRLSTLGELSDEVLAETVVNPVFDRGYFREIRVVVADGRTLVRKTLPPAPADVPSWFTALLPIESPGAEALVSAGWRQLGRVAVHSQPGFAYRQLWQTGVRTLALLAALYLAALAATTWFLSLLLRPLRDIEQAAIAIGHRSFVTIGASPRARELARVVEAMNAMSGSIQRAIADESGRAEALRREAYVDPLTSVYNRRGFERQLQALAQSTADVYSVALGLLELRGFAAFNARVGYQRADETLAAVAGVLTAASANGNVVCGRMGGAGFAFAVINVPEADLHRMVGALCDQLGLLLAEQAPDAALAFDCGVTRREGALPAFTDLLAAADHAVERARQKGPNSHEIEAFAAGSSAGSAAWKALIEGALERGAIALFAQEARAIPGGAQAHVEVTARLLREGAEPLLAAQFVPMASRHGLAARLDAGVLRKLLDYLPRAPAATVFAVNLSARTVADRDGAGRLLAMLGERPDLARRLIFEITEFGALHEWAAAKRFSDELRRRGARFALDNFGVLQESLMLVHALRPAYIKLAPGYTRELAGNADCRFMVASLVRIARSLDIDIYAQAVEDESLLPVLAELRIAGYQGYAVARPAPLD